MPESRVYEAGVTEPWYTESWYLEDLEDALEAAGVQATPESVARMWEACQNIFEDKSGRVEILREKAEELFGEE